MTPVRPRADGRWVTAEDAAIVLPRLRALAGDPAAGAFLFVHHGVPVPKARPRWSPKNHRMYTPATTAAAETSIAWLFRAALGGSVMFCDTVALVALFVVPTRQRKDLDNLLKLVMDAGNQARAWTDDSLVVAQAALLELDAAHPRTVIALCPYRGTLTRAPLLPERMD